MTHFHTKHMIVLSILIISSKVHAAGFYLSEIGTPNSLGTAGVANVTNTSSADAAWTNPAGMTELDDDLVSAGIQVLFPKIKFDSEIAQSGGSDGGNAGEITPIPSFFITKKLNDKIHVGFSSVGVLGGGMDYGDDFVGRYAVTEVSLEGLALSPSLGYKVNEELSVGVGASIVYTKFYQEIALPINNAPDGKIIFDDLDDWGLQPFVGLTYQFNKKISLGVVYRAEFDSELEGDIKLKNTPLSGTFKKKMELDWTNPQLLEIGLKYQIDDEHTFYANADWEDWSEFSENNISVANNNIVTLDRNFKDTWSVGFALQKKFTPESEMTVGFSYDSSPVDDKDRTLDLPFDEIIKLSLAYAWKAENNLDFAVGTTFMYAGDGKVDQMTTGGRVKGEFDKNYIIFLGTTVRYTF